MSNAANKVITGDYNGHIVVLAGDILYTTRDRIAISCRINKSTVDSYEVITDKHRKSAASGIARDTG